MLQCRCNYDYNNDYIRKLTEYLQKLDSPDVDINRQIDRIRNYLRIETKNTGSQALIGYRHIFRGIIVRDLENNKERAEKYKDQNKVITALFVKHYKNFWKLRNDRRFSIATQRKYILEWFEKNTTSI